MALLDLGGIIGGFGRNSRSVAVATVMTALGGLATSILLSRWLGPTEYGKYSYITWLVGVVVLVANLGLPSAATRFIAEYRALRPDWGYRLYRDLIRLELLAVVGLAGLLLLWGALRPSVFFAVGFTALLMVPTALSPGGYSALRSTRRRNWSARPCSWPFWLWSCLQDGLCKVCCGCCWPPRACGCFY